MDFNVHCHDCGSVWLAVPQSSQWWRGKRRKEQGYFDAVGVSGEECGCVPVVQEPDAPFRVFGYEDTGKEFDVPFHTFTKAVRALINAKKAGLMDVWISGVSPKVEQRLNFGC